MWQEIFQYLDEYFSFQSTADRQLKRLRVMFGRGEVDRKHFFRFLRRIQEGELVEGELCLLEREVKLQKQIKGDSLPDPRNREIQRGLERVYIGRALLEEARFAAEKTLQALAGEIDWIQGQAQIAEQEARQALPDENVARNYLEMRQNLVDHSGRLVNRRDELQRELRMLSSAEVQLRSYEAELRLVSTQEQLALANLQFHQGIRTLNR